MAQIRGGAKFESALRNIAASVAKPATLRIGFLESARYPTGVPVALIAAVQNWGAPAAGIPPRSFFDFFVTKNKDGWPSAISGLLKANDYDAAKALDLAGAAMTGQLKQAIIDTNAPPLKPATIARKGFAKPLIESSVMINSVDHEVQT